ncbi:hypothetical protein ABZ934_23345 [Streptomyces sp. NPDC046557]|uniref:hypothetical protein n=1 Tax=Streptomyces sp. NPDC046557 TaxID=3155372 RepID=UPI0033F57353
MTGTTYPPSGVTPLSAHEVRAALLALNRPDARFVVRQGTAKERADLVAECDVAAWALILKTRMRLDAPAREVRVLEERWEPVSEGSGRQYGRGPARTIYRKWEFKRGVDGRRRRVETLRFDTREMKDPLQKAVLGAGWTWRGVLFRF